MKCKLCWTNEATVRDRDRPGDKRKTICAECHRRRLAEDMSYLLRYNRARGIK